jgi:hypothetical protein
LGSYAAKRGCRASRWPAEHISMVMFIIHSGLL